MIAPGRDRELRPIGCPAPWRQSLLRRPGVRGPSSCGSGGWLEIRRAAFTLLEIIVVLAILVVLASLAWPSLLQYLADNSLREESHRVRVELSRTRVKAIDSGLTYQFRFEPGGDRFVVLPHDLPTDESTPASGGAGSNATAVGLTSTTNRLPVLSGELTGKVTFDYLQSINPENGALQVTPSQALPDAWLTLLPNSAVLGQVRWSPPVLFFPDGSAEDAEVVLVDDRQIEVAVTVRGFTGSVDSSEPRDAP